MSPLIESNVTKNSHKEKHYLAEIQSYNGDKCCETHVESYHNEEK